MKKVLYVYEFWSDLYSDNKGDPLGKAVFEDFDKIANKDFKVVSACGCFQSARGNGLAFKRFMNFLYMHFVAIFVMIRHRPDYVFVRTTPPLIQLTYNFLARIFRAKSIIWLMDYHPLFGLASTKKKSFMHFVWGCFEKIDRWLLKKTSAVVVLDTAMNDLIKERTQNKVFTMQSPTFSLNKVEWLNLATNKQKGEPIKFAYAGNLGKAHNIDDMYFYLEALSKENAIEIFYVGNSPYAINTFTEMCAKLNAKFTRLAYFEEYSQMGDFYKKEKIDYGLVILNQELKGLVSPSKFTGYTAFGLPIIYIGPADVNADDVCKNYNAGIYMNSKENVAHAVSKTLDRQMQSTYAANTQKFIDVYGEGAPQDLAEQLYDFLRKK